MSTIKATNKPLLRGHFHQAAFFISLGACLMLISQSKNSQQLISSIIYSIGLTGLLGVSALYHRPTWSTKKRKVMRRLDHCMIFILIAGTFTPLGLLSFPTEIGSRFLWICWLAAAAGCFQSLFWISAPKWLSAILYLIVGFLVLPYFPELFKVLSEYQMALIITGGVIYVIGAVVYTFKKPDPYPKTFGYHEIFHLLVIAAAACHFIFIKTLIG